MKTKHKTFPGLAVLALIFALTLSSCGGSDSAASDSVSSETNSSYDVETPSEKYDEGSYDDSASDWEMQSESIGEEKDTSSDTADFANISYSSSDKIIYTADVQIETTEFDDSVAAVYEMVDRYGGFIESSTLSGNRYSDYYYGATSNRYAYFSVRIPVESYNTATDNLDSLGNVTNINTYAQNVTVQYTDTESRLSSLRIEQNRLQELLEQADTVTDMIEIESRASEVRYEIESYESTLRNLQNQISYSTININLSEVERLTKVEEPNRTYWEKISDGMANTVDSIGVFFQDLFMNIAISLPLIAIWAVVIAVIVIVLRVIIKRRKHKKAVATDAEKRES